MRLPGKTFGRGWCKKKSKRSRRRPLGCDQNADVQSANDLANAVAYLAWIVERRGGFVTWTQSHDSAVWHHPGVRYVLAGPTFRRVYFDQCRYAARVPNVGRMKQPTVMYTNLPDLRCLELRCQCRCSHVVGGGTAAVPHQLARVWGSVVSSALTALTPSLLRWRRLLLYLAGGIGYLPGPRFGTRRVTFLYIYIYKY